MHYHSTTRPYLTYITYYKYKDVLGKVLFLSIEIPEFETKFQNSREISILNIVITELFPKRITQALPVRNSLVGYRKYNLSNPYPRGTFIPVFVLIPIFVLGYPYPSASLTFGNARALGILVPDPC